MIRHRVHVLRLKVIDFRRRSRLEWQETKHMSRVYRDRLLGRTTGSELREAHAQAGDMLRIVILGSTQIIPLPFIPTLLVILILKTGKALGIRVVPSNWHDGSEPAREDREKGEQQNEP